MSRPWSAYVQRLITCGCDVARGWTALLTSPVFCILVRRSADFFVCHMVEKTDRPAITCLRNCRKVATCLR